ncbi:transposase [Spiroplasma endosymbiont of Aleiodes alternator]|uniref:transposase n=1 Tax=Spiroplasma endosymbiont of Aleiodes alternator TaxID=3139329 RepID=UPI003CCB5433
MANINSYSDEFKKQIVALYQSGKSVSCLAKEYNVTRAATYNWIKQFWTCQEKWTIKVTFY